MEIQFLVSTQNQTNLDFLNQMFQKVDLEKLNILVINQCSKDVHQAVQNRANIVCINSKEKGLSKSRNLALKSSKAKIVVLCDDDTVIAEDAPQKILRAFEYCDSDIITFKFAYLENYEDRKNYATEIYKHSIKSLAGVCSVEIAFKRQSLIQNGLSFNESFGLGALYPTGEESILLYEARNRGLKIFYVPSLICYPPQSRNKRRKIYEGSC